MRRILSKSSYLSGLECPKYLWVIFNQPEKIRKETLAEKFTFNEGVIVGEIAKQLFSKGINIPYDDYSENIPKTKEFLVKKKPLFEAGFEFNNCYSKFNKWNFYVFTLRIFYYLNIIRGNYAAI